MKPEVHEFIDQAPLSRASVEGLAGMLPEDDAELDSWIGEIVRACGLICVMRGTGENHFPAVRAQTRSKSLLASEAVPSMQGARRDRFDDGLARNARN